MEVALEKELRMFLRQVGVPTNVRDWMTAMRACPAAVAEVPRTHWDCPSR